MAKLSSHGRIIGSIEYSTYTIRYMEDGHILKNAGFGWKLYKKVKADYTPSQVYQIRNQSQIEFLNNNPHTKNFLNALHRTCGLTKRWKLYSAIELMYDDPDGVWSEVCDSYEDNIHASIEEIVNLCGLYVLAVEESKNRIQKTKES